MSDKFFFKGKKEKKPKHSSYGYNTKRQVKTGTKELPVEVTVCDEQRAEEIKALAETHQLVVSVNINPDAVEDSSALDLLINKPKTVRVEKTPARNEPCVCGSGKKYKKCCALK